MKRILVTGGAGAIGSNLARALLCEQNTKIVIVDNLSSGHEKNIPAESEFIQGDISDKSFINKVMSQSFDEIYHLAAFFANQNSCDNPVEDFLSNAYGTLLLLQAAVNQPSLQCFLYAGTSSVHTDLDNDLRDGFSTPYMTSKFTGELYGKYYSLRHKVPFKNVRYFNCYGPGEFPGKYRNVIINFLDRALSGEELVITGDGTETRDYTYVDDIVAGTLLVARCPTAVGKILNIGTAKETCIAEIAQMINELTGNPSPVRFVESRQWDRTRRRCGDLSLTQELTTYEPRIDLREGLRRTLSWYESVRGA